MIILRLEDHVFALLDTFIYMPGMCRPDKNTYVNLASIVVMIFMWIKMIEKLPFLGFFIQCLMAKLKLNSFTGAHFKLGRPKPSCGS